MKVQTKTTYITDNFEGQPIEFDNEKECKNFERQVDVFLILKKIQINSNKKINFDFEKFAKLFVIVEDEMQNKA